MISTTIKKEYMELILKGEKKVEYKEINEYWGKRIEKIFDTPSSSEWKINFLCGRKSYKFRLKGIVPSPTPPELRNLIKGAFCWHINLGEMYCPECKDTLMTEHNIFWSCDKCGIIWKKPIHLGERIGGD